MPTKEIKELRQAGKLEEALSLAKSEMEADPENIWTKRNISWVYYDYLKQNISLESFEAFEHWLDEIKNLKMPIDEKLIFEQLSWTVGKMGFTLLKSGTVDEQKAIRLFDSIQSLTLPKPSQGYSFLFKAFHKIFKDTNKYLQFADWWDFNNFLPEDFNKEQLPNGKQIMSIAEQAYIAYAKHLLPITTHTGEIVFNEEKAIEFLPILSDVVSNFPQFQYPAYYHVKLLLALGNKNQIMESLLPFAKKKRNDFWVWELLAEAFIEDQEKVFVCYCKALSCKSPEEMLVNLRQKMAGLLISKKLFNEAKTEIEILIDTRNKHGFKIPSDVERWQNQDWFKNAKSLESNSGLYIQNVPFAESLLFIDIPEETVIVEFVNTDRKILNFIATESKFGFFKYDRFFKDVKVGDTLLVRFQGGSNEGMHQIYTAFKTNNEEFKKRFVKEVEGIVRIPEGKSFGFLSDAYIHPSTVSRSKLSNGIHVKGLAIKTYNKEKKEWQWKLV